MKILVLGASGYLGSHLVKYFVNAGNQVQGMVRNETAAQIIQAMGAESVLGDLIQIDAVCALVESVDVVLYAAQLDLVPEHETVKRLLEVLDGSGKTFIFTSGTGVLSQRTDGDWSEDSFSEDEEFTPSKYIGYRLQTENSVRDAANRGVRAYVVRPPLIWGNGGCPVIKQFFECAGRIGEVCYVGRGLNLYSNVHVEDLVKLYGLVVEKGTPGALYHAVSGETNFRTIARAVAERLGLSTRSVKLEEAISIWDKFTALVALSTCSRSRSPKARKELGWAPDPERLDILDDINHPDYLACYEAKKH